jgi:Bacterial SH3 domain
MMRFVFEGRARKRLKVMPLVALLLILSIVAGFDRTTAQESTPVATPAATGTPTAETAQSDTVTAAALTGAQFTVNDDVWVVDGPLNLRVSAGIEADVVDTLPTATELQILDGPVDEDGFSWFRVERANGDSGWVAGDFLASGDAVRRGRRH